MFRLLLHKFSGQGQTIKFYGNGAVAANHVVTPVHGQGILVIAVTLLRAAGPHDNAVSQYFTVNERHLVGMTGQEQGIGVAYEAAFAEYGT